MITPRDQKIIDYLKTNEADVEKLRELFFPGMSLQWTRKRLNQLVNRGHIKRKKGVDDKYFIYWR